MTPGRDEAGHDWVAGTADEGSRLDVALSDWLGEPRARSQQRIAAGEVRVDGRVAAKSLKLAAGQRVVLRGPAAPVPPPPGPPLPIRFRDEHLVVVAKPPGLVVHPAGAAPEPSVVSALRGMGVPLAPAGGAERPGVVHRLDRGTSGLLVVACTDEAHERLVRALSRREVTRRYQAIVDGVPAEASATIDAPIARDPRRRTRFRVDPAGRSALTHYDVAEAFDDAAHLAVRLETGRTHQIRVHLAAIGHPVTGDRRYGASAGRALALGLERPALHAAHLEFAHPVTGERVAVDEPLPPDLATALVRLRATTMGDTSYGGSG